MNQPILKLSRSTKKAEALPVPALLTTDFYMVWRVGSDRVRKRHSTRELAEAEAHRLAGIFPDRTFYVVHACAAYGKAE